MKKYQKYIIPIIITTGIVLFVLSVVFSSIRNKDVLGLQQAAVLKSGISYLGKESVVETATFIEIKPEESQDVINGTAKKPIDEIPESSDTADEAVIDTPVISPEIILIKNPALTKGCNERSPKSITVLAPNGGEVYSIGSPVAAANYIDIKWVSCNIPGNQLVRVELISGIDAGVFASPTTLFSFISMNTGSQRVLLRQDTFSFNAGIINFTTMPTTTPITPGTNFKVKITASSSIYPNNNPQFNGVNINDSSNNFFSIFDGCTAMIENVLPASATSSLVNAQEPAVPVMKLKVTARNCSLEIKRLNYLQVNLPYYQTFAPFSGEVIQNDPRTRTGLLYDFRITEQVGFDSVDLSNLDHPYRIAHWYNNFSGESNTSQFFGWLINGTASYVGSMYGLNWVADLPPALWNSSPNGSESNPQQFYDKGWVIFKDDVVINAGSFRIFNINAKPTRTVLKWFHDNPCSVSVFGLSNDDNSDDYSYCGVYADQNPPNGRRENQNIQLILSEFDLENIQNPDDEVVIYTPGLSAPTSELINIY